MHPVSFFPPSLHPAMNVLIAMFCLALLISVGVRSGGWGYQVSFLIIVVLFATSPTVTAVSRRISKIVAATSSRLLLERTLAVIRCPDQAVVTAVPVPPRML